MPVPGVIASGYKVPSGGSGTGALVTGSGKKYTRSASGLNLTTTSITWCAWAKLASDINNYVIVLASDDAGSHYCQFSTTNNGTTFQLSNGGVSTFDFTPGTWAFVAATIDRTGAECWLYWANSPATTLSRDFFFAIPTSHFLDTNTFHIGGDGFSLYWPGSIAAVKVWNAVLTQTELTTEATKYAPVRTANLWAAYKFDNGPQTTDDSGNGRTLTATGTPTTDASGPPCT